MTDLERFFNAVNSALNFDLDPQQLEIVRAPANECLWVVAGPGSGKTATLALRVLKLILIDSLEPSGIIATTFTRRGAAELRSRILGWGNRLARALDLDAAQMNLNQIVTGTLDSIIREVLSDYRAPGLPAPTVIEDFVADSLIIREALLPLELSGYRQLFAYLVELRGSAYQLDIGKMAQVIREIRERIIHDQVDLGLWNRQSQRQGVAAVCQAIQLYEQELRERLLCDYPELERQFFDRLTNGEFDAFLSGIRYVVVDEYQDTNKLQEKIYLRLAQAAYTAGGGITVVGDDDQSLFRFRGATVDLFLGFARSLEKGLGVAPQLRYLYANYRSTRTIVDFLNRFVAVDPDYHEARIPGKPGIEPRRGGAPGYPVLGLFREDIEALARDLAMFIHRVIFGRYMLRTRSGREIVIQLHSEGSPGDIVVLCDSPQEYSTGGRARLPLFLRSYLASANPPVSVFNPRGQPLEKVPCVARLCGLVLECLDPQKACQGSMRIPSEIEEVLKRWREEARRYLAGFVRPDLLHFVSAWQRREPTTGASRGGHVEVPLVDLVYKLITWIPEMQNDVEGLVYLEAITRTITQSALISDFQGKVVFEHHSPDGALGFASVRDALRNVFIPLAAGAIKIDEDLMETLPPDRVNIMSIHQSKGLEFPVVIVDVGSDFRSAHPAQAFKRFPTRPATEHRLEDELRPYSEMGIPPRSPLDRAFDDLVRRFFVAYSRAQDLLVLVGLNAVRRGRVPSVATGWARSGNWAWRGEIPYMMEIGEV